MQQIHGTPDRLTRLAAGASAEVYAWQDDRVIKLFRRDFPSEAIEVELRHARIVHGLGVPTPRVEGTVQVNGRTGIVFERHDGPTLYELIQGRARAPGELARALFELQREIHRHESAYLQPVQARLSKKLAYANHVPASLRNEALGAVMVVPVTNTVCHGDFHPINVIMSPRGAVAIDWLDASRGDPAHDVTRTLLFLKYARPQQIDPAARAQFVEAYAGACREAWGERIEQLRRWQFPMAVARLCEVADETERRGLLQLVERTSDLWS